MHCPLSFFLLRVSHFYANYCAYRCIARSLFRSVARFLLLATPALVCYPLSPSTLRDSLPLLDTLATGALPALFPPVAHLSFLLLITVITGVERTQTGRGKDNAGVQ